MSGEPEQSVFAGSESLARSGREPGPRIAVVGGGISGLAAAHRLLELDSSAELTLFEAGDRVGGVLKSENVDGFCIEHGPDSLLAQLPWGTDLCRRIGFSEELIGTNTDRRQTWIVRSGRLVPLPEGLAIMAPSRIWPLVRSPVLSFPGLLRLACEVGVPRRRDASDESLADFACRRVGRETYERLVQPLVSGIYMADPQKLSMQAALPRFVTMESEHGSLIRAARRGMKKRPPKAPSSDSSQTPTTMFVAPRRGMGSLVAALEARLPQQVIRRHSKVTELTRQTDGAWRLSGQHGSGGFDESFESVILATPSDGSARLLQQTDESLASELSQLEHSGCVVVTLAFARDDVAHPLDGYGFVVPLIEQRDIVACTLSSVKYAHRAPEGQVLLRVFLGGAMRPDLMDLDDEAILGIAQCELKDLIGVRGVPVLSRVIRWPNVMPQYHIGHLDRIGRIEAAVEKLPGLELAGNSYRGVGIPHCIHSGEEVAERIHRAVCKTT